MGGNALKKVKTRRYTTSELEQVKKVLIPKLQQLLQTQIYAVKSYYGKPDHGDLDLLLQTPFRNVNLLTFLKDEMGALEVFPNGNVYSFNYDDLQVDLILIKKEHWETAKPFYDYNDLGNLIGKLANFLGLKFGPEGLKYSLYDETRIHKLETVFLSSDLKRIFKVLDLDYKRYLLGFNKLEDIFEFISQSKWFNKTPATLAALNSDQRHRDKKRKNILAFQEWVEKKNEVEFKPKFTRDETLDFIHKNFPEIGIYRVVEKYERDFKKKQFIAEKFNGRVIQSYFPSLVGKPLGDAIIKFKQYLDEEYNTYILNTDIETIMDEFKKINNL